MSDNQYETMLEAIAALKRRGFTENFELAAGGLRALGTGRVYEPQALHIVEHHRFEGQTDPDDMSVLYAIAAEDGTRGLIADAFGPYADPELGRVLRRIPAAPQATG